MKCQRCNGRGWLKASVNGFVTACPTCNGSGDSSKPATHPIKFVATYDYGVLTEENWKKLRKKESEKEK